EVDRVQSRNVDTQFHGGRAEQDRKETVRLTDFPQASLFRTEVPSFPGAEPESLLPNRAPLPVDLGRMLTGFEVEKWMAGSHEHDRESGVQLAKEPVLTPPAVVLLRHATLEENASIVQAESRLIPERSRFFRDEAVRHGSLEQRLDQRVELSRGERTDRLWVRPERSSPSLLRSARASRRPQQLAEGAARPASYDEILVAQSQIPARQRS